MRYWCSTTIIEQSLEKKLFQAGLSELNQCELANDIGHEVMFIYSTPHSVIEKLRKQQSTPATGQEIDKIYIENRDLASKCKLAVADWRLNQLDQTCLIRLINNQPPKLSRREAAPEINALAGLITLKLIHEEPSILTTYLDLELKSYLSSLPPDSQYESRIRDSISIDQVLASWWDHNHHREASFEEATMNLRRAEQIQEDYDCITRQQDELKSLLKANSDLTMKVLVELAKHINPSEK